MGIQIKGPMFPLLQKALQHSFSPKKLFFAFPFLFLCCTLILLCHKLLTNTENWLTLSLSFLPILGTGSLLLTLGIFLIRSYHQEKTQQKILFISTLQQSFSILLKLSYFSLPLVLIVLAKKLIVFICMGLLYLWKHWGFMTEGTENFLSGFLPIFILCGITLLGFLSLFALYFVTPHLAFTPSNPFRILQERLKSGKTQAKKFLFLLGIGVLPFLILSPILLWSLSSFSWDLSEKTIIYPVGIFSLFLTPSIIFFFNFSLESYLLLQEAPILEKTES
ncbi:MAG: hypothetical protein WCP39_08165 [Chlamydiota bacterium]